MFDPSLEADEALQAFGRTYIDHVNMLAGDARSATLSLIRTSGLDSLAARVAESLPLFSESTADMITCLQHFDRPGSYGESPALPRCFDLGQWIGEVSCTGSHAIFEKQMDRTGEYRAFPAFGKRVCDKTPFGTYDIYPAEGFSPSQRRLAEDGLV